MKVRRKKPEAQTLTLEDQESSTPQDEQSLYAFTYEGVAYQTLLTKKYQSRKPYSPPDLRKVTAFIPGTIITVMVKEKDKVKKGDPLLSLQAMKMNNILVAPIDGQIRKIHINKGDVVVKNQLLIEFR